MSASEMYAAAKRFQKYADGGLKTIILHLGDHDPGGNDMTLDIKARLKTLSHGADIEVLMLALNLDQVEEYGLPLLPPMKSEVDLGLSGKGKA